MILIKDCLRDVDLSYDCTEKHKVKKPYKIDPKKKAGDSEFMQDARIGRVRATRTPAFSLPREVKKLSWYEKFILCRKVDLHKENYQGYRERRELFIQNAEILHHLRKTPGLPKKPSAPIAYKNWNAEQCDWVELEKALYGTTDRQTVESPPPPPPRTAVVDEGLDDEFLFTGSQQPPVEDEMRIPTAGSKSYPFPPLKPSHAGQFRLLSLYSLSISLPAHGLFLPPPRA